MKNMVVIAVIASVFAAGAGRQLMNLQPVGKGPKGEERTTVSARLHDPLTREAICGLSVHIVAK